MITSSWGILQTNGQTKRRNGRLGGPDARVIRATAKVAANLERAGDAGTHIAKRVRIICRERVELVEFAFPDVEAIALTAVTEATPNRSWNGTSSSPGARACESPSWTRVT